MSLNSNSLTEDESVKVDQPQKQSQDNSDANKIVEARDAAFQKVIDFVKEGYGVVSEAAKDCGNGLVFGENQSVVEKVCKRLGKEIGADDARDFANALVEIQSGNREKGVEQLIDSGIRLFKAAANDYAAAKGVLPEKTMAVPIDEVRLGGEMGEVMRYKLKQVEQKSAAAKR